MAWACLLIFGTVIAGVPTALAHPTDGELRQDWEDRQRCHSTIAWSKRADPIRLGTKLAELRMSAQEPFSLYDPDASAESPATKETSAQDRPIRLERKAEGELTRIQYELWQDAVYRIRWQLNSSFERPILDELVRLARTCFGPPEYDQTFEAEPGSPAATLRRVGWTHADRRIELRQLHPLRGGPVYLSVSDADALRKLGLAGLAPFPDPTTSKPWWRRSMAPLETVQAEERERLGQAFLGILGQLDH